ncbi:MAG: sugar transferase [bacterium]
MQSRTKIRSWILLIGDVIILYLALALTLFLRGGGDFLQEFWTQHVVPFTILNLIWVVIFYINDLYAHHHFRISGAFIQSFGRAMLVNAIATVIFFYLVPDFGVTPKTNLFIFVIAFSILFLAWRAVVGKLLTHEEMKKAVLFLAVSNESLSLADELSNNPLSQYKVAGIITPDEQSHSPLSSGIELMPAFLRIEQIIAERKIEMIVIGDTALDRMRADLFPMLLQGATITTATTFWEHYHRKSPVDIANTDWAINSFSNIQNKEFDFLKRVADIDLTLIIGIVMSWLMVIIAFVIKLTSRGPIFYKQDRIGKFGQPFTLVKFRTMTHDAEKDGPQWSVKNDPRVTKIGKILRHTHLDELPQLYNILKGDMSFIGPRPERPNFVDILSDQIPFYPLRHLVNPGISGWAQINYRYGSSVEDAKCKLAYDLYYIKHRSFFFDFKIALKTIAMLFRGEGR